MTCDMTAVSLLESAEWRYIKAMNNDLTTNELYIFMQNQPGGDSVAWVVYLFPPLLGPLEATPR